MSSREQPPHGMRSFWQRAVSGLDHSYQHLASRYLEIWSSTHASLWKGKELSAFSPLPISLLAGPHLHLRKQIALDYSTQPSVVPLKPGYDEKELLYSTPLPVSIFGSPPPSEAPVPDSAASQSIPKQLWHKSDMTFASFIGLWIAAVNLTTVSLMSHCHCFTKWWAEAPADSGKTPRSVHIWKTFFLTITDKLFFILINRRF